MCSVMVSLVFHHQRQRAYITLCFESGGNQRSHIISHHSLMRCPTHPVAKPTAKVLDDTPSASEARVQHLQAELANAKSEREEAMRTRHEVAVHMKSVLVSDEAGSWVSGR